MKASELSWLSNIAAKMTSIVEVGSFKGKSTHAFLNSCTGPVYAVDTFCGSPVKREFIYDNEPDVYSEFMKNVGHFKNLVPMRMCSIDAALMFEPKSIDLVFIDGCHEYESVVEDLLAWRSVCKKILCGHDIRSDNVKSALKDMGIDYEIKAGDIWCHEC